MRRPPRPANAVVVSLARRNGASLGQMSMRERVRLLSGELDIESTLGHGMTVVAWVPLGSSAS